MACYPGQPTNVDSAEESMYCADRDVFEGNSRSSLKPHSTQSIVTWLEDTYHYEDGICLPRSTIYDHYKDFSQRENLQPINAASFGKIIRQQFPHLTTRRLGTRGQSKYHYYGLGIKPTSIYYTEEYLQKQQNQGITRKEPETKKPHAYYSGKEKPSVVLPNFPDVKNLKQVETVPKDKLQTFMVMYRAHCQRILDSVVRANFDEVEYFLLHFWQGMPSHLLSVLTSELVVDLVAVCDMTLYSSVISVFITTPLQNIPDNVAQEVKRFTGNLKDWLREALKDIPQCLSAVKFKAADMFCKSFRRQRSLMHLADAARNAFKGDETLEQLENDWSGLNLQNVFAQTLYTIQPLGVPQHYLDMVPNFLEDFSCMFTYEKCSIEDFALWIDSIMDNCLKDISKGSRTVAGKVFLLTWKFFTSKVVRDFTLMSAPSFGTFHLLHMLVDDYILHTIETMRDKEEQEKHLDRINCLKLDIIDDEPVNEASLDLESMDVPSSQIPSTASQSVSQFPPTFEPMRRDHTSSLDPAPLMVAPAREKRPRPSDIIREASEHDAMPINYSELVGGSSVSNNQKSEFSCSTSATESISQALHCLQDPAMMISGGDVGQELPMHLEQQLQGGPIQRPGGVTSRGGNRPQQQHHHERDMYRSGNLLSPPGQTHEPRHVATSGRSQNTLTSPNITRGRSLSHPNLSNMSRESEPAGSMIQQTPADMPSSKGGPPPQTVHASILTHSQSTNQAPPIPFHGNLGFALSSCMMGQIPPQLHPPSLQTPAVNSPNQSGIDPDMRNMSQPQGRSSVSSSRNSTGECQSRISATTSSGLSGQSLLAGGGLNPPLSIVNPPFNMGGVGLPGGGLGGSGGGGGVVNLPHTSNPSMPLAHPIACNAPSLPLLPGMPAVYSYPYSATLPTQSISSSMVRMNAPGPAGFPQPGQAALAPGGGYNQYMAPSLYGNAQPPPVSTGNFTR